MWLVYFIQDPGAVVTTPGKRDYSLKVLLICKRRRSYSFIEASRYKLRLCYVSDGRTCELVFSYNIIFYVLFIYLFIYFFSYFIMKLVTV